MERLLRMVQKYVQAAEEKSHLTHGGPPDNPHSGGYLTMNNPVVGYSSLEEFDSWDRRRTRPDGVRVAFLNDREGQGD